MSIDVLLFHGGVNLIAREQDNQLQYYLFNAHGDVIERTSQNGTTLKRYDFDAFGNELSPEILDSNPWRFCGEYFDREADTLYLRARNYNSKNGRMLGEDSIRDGLNWYTYCGNNPVMYTDRTGLSAERISYSYSYDPREIANFYNDHREYYRITIKIDAGSQISNHVFYIQRDVDVMIFSNVYNNTTLATRSTDLAEGMLAAFKKIKGYELSGRTIAGVHSELVYHELLYRASYRIESSRESNIGTLNIPFGRDVNDPDAMYFEAVKGTASVARGSMATWNEQVAKMQQFRNDFNYFFSGNYFIDKPLLCAFRESQLKT
jgi:RHS repeat-associated protein